MENILDSLACALGRNDEAPNIALAEKLCENGDAEGIAALVRGACGKNRAVAHDCIKALYEIGERRPELIADFADDFITLLHSPGNRLVWGGMTALAQIADICPGAIFSRINEVTAAAASGSVITVDNSVTVLAKLCAGGNEYAETLFPLLIKHIETCRPKEVAQHAERMALCINAENIAAFASALQARMPDITPAQQKRLEKLMKRLVKQYAAK